MRSISLRRPTRPVAIEPNTRAFRMAYFWKTGWASLVTSARVMELPLVTLFIRGFYRRERGESQEAEDRDQKSEVRDQKSEVRDRTSEIRDQKRGWIVNHTAEH